MWAADGEVVAAATAERIIINISGSFPTGYVYRLMEARVFLKSSNTASLAEYGRNLAGIIILNNPSAGGSQNIDFQLSDSQPGQSASPSTPNRYDNNTQAFGIMYGPMIPLPNTPITARGTAAWQLKLASDANTTLAGELNVYVRALRYSIADDEAWRIHTPVPVTF